MTDTDTKQNETPKRSAFVTSCLMSWSSLVGAVFAGLVFVKLSQPLRDNSLFTHIATGRYILANGSIPAEDVYTYTAEGTPWVVQSWLVSFIYAGLEAVFGAGVIRVLAGLLGAALVLFLWALTKPLNLLVRATAMSIITLSCLMFLSPRPTLFGAIFLILTVAASRGSIPPVVLVPVGAVWVNAHGSWPTGVAVAAILLFATICDKGPWRQAPLRSLLALLGGFLLGALGPLGVSSLTFPVGMMQRQDVLKYIIEWQKPDLLSIQTIFLWSLLLLAVAGWWSDRTWRSGLLIIFSVAFGFSANRNIPIATLLLLFPVIDGMQGIGRDLGRTKSPWATGLAASFSAVCLLTGTFLPATWDYSSYPEEATDQIELWGWMQNSDVRIAGAMNAGNYWSLRYGPTHKILVDDRFDMYDKDLIEQFMVVSQKNRSPEERLAALDIFAPDVVVWPTEKDLFNDLEASDQWKQILSYDNGWAVFCRISSVSIPCSAL
jgi:hypothetical protein